MSDDGGQPEILTRLLEGAVCFDATVPLYLSELGYAAGLANVFKGRAMVPKAVYRELDGLSHHGFPAARTLLKPRPFARVVELSGEELEQVLARQRRWNGDRVFDDPSEDRGEAECIQLCRRYADFSLALCAHDHKARNDPDARGIMKLDAIHVCLLLALRGHSSFDAWRIYVGLVGRGMNPVRRFPPSADGEELFIEIVENARRFITRAGVAR